MFFRANIRFFYFMPQPHADIGQTADLQVRQYLLQQYQTHLELEQKHSDALVLAPDLVDSEDKDGSA